MFLTKIIYLVIRKFHQTIILLCLFSNNNFSNNNSYHALSTGSVQCTENCSSVNFKSNYSLPHFHCYIMIIFQISFAFMQVIFLLKHGNSQNKMYFSNYSLQIRFSLSIPKFSHLNDYQSVISVLLFFSQSILKFLDKDSGDLTVIIIVY